MPNKLSVFGASGFIGNEFCNTFPRSTIRMSKVGTIPHTNKILFFISTTDNYNVLTNPFIDIETNLLLFMDILSQCQGRFDKDVEFNFISSWFVYGRQDRLPAKEDAHCDPTGFYSVTKRAAEQLLISYCETFGIKYRILRLANVIGVGDNKVSKKKNALQYMIKELSTGGEINLYKGRFIRDYIDVRDCVQAINLVISRGKLNEIYNIGNGEPENIRELVSYAWFGTKVGKILDVDSPQFHKTVQTDSMYLDISKLKRLGYHREYSIRQSINDLIRHYQNG